MIDAVPIHFYTVVADSRNRIAVGISGVTAVGVGRRVCDWAVEVVVRSRCAHIGRVRTIARFPRERRAAGVVGAVPVDRNGAPVLIEINRRLIDGAVVRSADDDRTCGIANFEYLAVRNGVTLGDGLVTTITGSGTRVVRAGVGCRRWRVLRNVRTRLRLSAPRRFRSHPPRVDSRQLLTHARTM